MEVIKSPFSRVSVWPDDPRELADPTVNRHFDVHIHHSLGNQAPEEQISCISVDGTVDKVLNLLDALGIEITELHAGIMRGDSKLTISAASLSREELAKRLLHDPNPTDSFVLNVQKHEIEERINRWQRNSGEADTDLS